MRRIRPFLGSVLLSTCAASAGAATYTVTASGDSGAGTISAAITAANGNPGLDTIEFDIPGTPPFGVSIFMGIPTITDAVVIDGTTQPGYAGTPLFLIRSGLGQGPGLILGPGSGGSTIRGLAFADINTGIRILSDGNKIESCFFGTDVTGMADLGLTVIGIQIQSADDNVIGGTSEGSRNLISGNNGFGVQLTGGSGNVIRGNLIGTKVNGTEPLGNQVGIADSGGTGTVIGGTAAGVGNVISANAFGIELNGTFDTIVAGNRIGTDAAGGTLPLGNDIGVRATTGAGLLIGGNTPSAGNVFADNDSGIVIVSGEEAEILGNWIGLAADLLQPLGNGDGILVNGAAATDTRIGGVGGGEANHIAYNETGIRNFGTRTEIRGNSIHDNAGLGIDHQALGPTPNDFVNGVQNFPIIDSVVYSPGGAAEGSSVRVQGSLQDVAGDYVIDFYANPPCAEDPQEFLEGQIYAGSTEVTVTAGEAFFDLTLPTGVFPGSRISATATDSTGNTSEFSQRLPWKITPATGPGAGGTMITVDGTNFQSGLTATIGGAPVTNLGPIFGVFFTGNTPALPGGVWDLTVTLPSGRTGTLPRAWTVDFADVPPSDPFYSFVQILVRHGITAGIGGGSYGRNQSTLRQQMAVFLLKAIHGICYIPPPCAGVFDDVPCPSTFADWIEAFAAAGITGGCGGDLYCPANPVRRDQMAVFLLKAKYGSSHVPPPCTGVFDDVACPSPFADWIEQLAAEEITGGCGAGNTYCPLTPTTRGQMAVFITKTFELE
jgi:hypothetical protein